MKREALSSILKKPSAWIPIAISLLFFIYLVTVITIFGIHREEDEGTGAHLFQIWLVLEPFMVGYFTVKYLPIARVQALQILAIQIISAFLPVFIVFYFNL